MAGPREDGQTVYLAGRKKAGRLLDGRTWDEFPKSLGKQLIEAGRRRRREVEAR